VKIWTVISCGDGEAYSAWVTQELAWQGALALAKSINERMRKPSLANIFENTRIRVDTEGYEVVVETLRRIDHYRPDTDMRRWERHATVRVSSVEVKGDAIDALAKLA
jgi:hypothetical protein